MPKWRTYSNARNPEPFVAHQNREFTKFKAWSIETIHSQCLSISRINNSCHHICQTTVIRIQTNISQFHQIIINRFHRKQCFQPITLFHSKRTTSLPISHCSRNNRSIMLQCHRQTMLQYRQTICIQLTLSCKIQMWTYRQHTRLQV